jgi:hypothetical protein
LRVTQPSTLAPSGRKIMAGKMNKLIKINNKDIKFPPTSSIYKNLSSLPFRNN